MKTITRAQCKALQYYAQPNAARGRVAGSFIRENTLYSLHAGGYLQDWQVTEKGFLAINRYIDAQAVR